MIANKSTPTSKTAFIGERQVKASVNNASDSIEVVKHELSLEGHSGPLPCSKEFEAYERVSPGAANRILIMAEQEQMHRHKMEEMLTAAAVQDTKDERKEIKRAQWLAWSLGLVVLMIGGFLMFSGHPIIGSFLTGGTLVGIIAAFLDRSEIKKKSSTSNANTSDENKTITHVSKRRDK